MRGGARKAESGSDPPAHRADHAQVALADVVQSYIVVALALGFPVVVAPAWALDVKEGRIERADVPGSRWHGPRLWLLRSEAEVQHDASSTLAVTATQLDP